MLAALDGRREMHKQPAVDGHRGRNAARTAGRLSVEGWAFCVLGMLLQRSQNP